MPRKMASRLTCGCGPCRPKWVKVVDNIYSNSQTDGINKLVCYCARKPDRLDNIAKHLHKKLDYYLHHGNYQNVNITMEAISALVNACYRLKLNLFDSSFLKMVQLLLESRLSDLQLLGTKCFLEFSQIEEDSPNYHREYDELVDHFTKMSYSNLPDLLDRRRVRMAGIQGLQGIVRKTARDQLQMNVLQSSSMEKIIPALLFNIHDKSPITLEPKESESDPSKQAVFVFKDVVCRASYTNIIPVVTAILTHLNTQNLWVPSDFPLLVFGYFLDSIKNMQIAHNLVKEMISYLRQHNSKLTPSQRMSVVQVLDKTVVTLAKGAIGPDVFHNFNALLQILRSSIEKTSKAAVTEEQRFQETIISTIAEFAKNLPDAQKIEILKFILNFDPLPRGRSDSKDYSKPMLKVLVKTMLTVATQYKAVSISNALDSDFLCFLLHGVAVDPDPSIRVYVQKILHALIDRHGNVETLLNVRVHPMNEVLDVYKREKPSRQDILFMKKTGFMLTENLYHQLLDSSNKVDNLEHLFCTIGLIALEMGADEVIVELLRLVLAVQQKILEPISPLPLPHVCALHAILACVMSLIVPLAPLPNLLPSVESVIKYRQDSACYLLPNVAFNRKNTQDTYPTRLVIPNEMLFSLDTIKEAIIDEDFDPATLDMPYPVFDPLKTLPRIRVIPGTRTSEYTGSGGSEYGTVQSANKLSTYGQQFRFQSGNTTLVYDPQEINRLNMANLGFAADQNSDSNSSISVSGSLHSTLNISSRASDFDNNEFLSFNTAHIILHEPLEARKERKAMENKQASQQYQSLGFDELCAKHRLKAQAARVNMTEVFNDLSNEISRRSRLGRSRLSQNTERRLSLLRGREREDSVGEIHLIAPTRDSVDEETPQKPNATTWDNNFISLFVA